MMQLQSLERWKETDWLMQLTLRAGRLTSCEDDASDLAHACLYAYYTRFRAFPWQAAARGHAWRWCCQKIRSLYPDALRATQRHPCLLL